MVEQAPEASGPAAAAPRPEGAPRRLRLELDDPWDASAAEDRPEAWGDERRTAQQRLAEYRENRPPHHG